MDEVDDWRPRYINRSFCRTERPPSARSFQSGSHIWYCPEPLTRQRIWPSLFALCSEISKLGDFEQGFFKLISELPRIQYYTNRDRPPFRQVCQNVAPQISVSEAPPLHPFSRKLLARVCATRCPHVQVRNGFLSLCRSRSHTLIQVTCRGTGVLYA